MNFLNKTVKRVGFGNKDLIKGIDIIADAVGSTLGAGGRTVIIEDDHGGSHVTKDGVTVAKSIILEDPVQNLGANLVREAASQTASKAGDGTTTSMVLAQSIIKLYVDKEADQFSFRDVRAGIEETSANIIKYLEKKALPVDNKRLEQVSIISTNNDEKLGKVVAEAFLSAGNNGVVKMESSMTSATYVDTVEGTRLSGRSKSPHFHTNPDKETCELEKPLIFISSTDIDTVRTIQGILEHAITTKRSILLIAPLKEQPLMALAMNNVKGNIKANVIDPPSFGLKRKDLLDDLALLVGAKVFDDTLGDAIDAISPDMLGEADKAISDNDGTVLVIDEKGDDAETRIAELKEALGNTENPGMIRHYEARLALLSGGVSIINVGADTEGELEEKRDRVEDAISAVKAAKKEGILPGGGSALLHAIKPSKDTSNKGYLAGCNIMLEAAISPFDKILNNAGLDSASYDLNFKFGYGVDAIDGKVKDLRKAGIVDPLLVTKQALINAVSVANTILSTDCVISNIRTHESSR